MNIAIWLLVCLFVSIGIVQVIGWLICRRRRPGGVRRGYHVIPLYDGPEQTEAQLRYCLAQLHWGGGGGDIAILLDMGLTEEGVAICDEMIRRHAMLYCKEEQLADTIRRLDELQDL